MALSAFFQWRMTLVCVAATPFVMLGGLVNSRLGWGSRNRDQAKEQSAKRLADAYEQSNALLSDVILNYRTVISFGGANIDSIMAKYENLL